MEKIIGDFKPSVFSDFLNPKYYQYVYDKVNNKIKNNIENGLDIFDDFEIHKNGFALYMFSFEEDSNFLNYIRETLSKFLNLNVSTAHGFFARYSKNTGYDPTLMPHLDGNGMDTNIRMLTLTLKLDSTLDWPIYVDEERYDLNKNDIVCFVGSKHVHWRPKSNFNEDDYYDIMVVHFELEGYMEELPKNFKELKEIERIKYEKKYSEMLGLTND